MFGKHFECMYTGSMFGAGTNVFAVWGWIIAHAVRGRVEINPKVLCATLGTTLEEVEGALQFLQQEDQQSRNKSHNGKRLVREGEYQYFIPTHEIYNKIANEEERRAYLRGKKREERSRNSVNRCQQRSTMSTHTDTDTNTDTNTKRSASRAADAACHLDKKIRERFGLPSDKKITKREREIYTRIENRQK